MLRLVLGIVVSAHVLLSSDLLLPAVVLSQSVLLVVLGSGLRLALRRLRKLRRWWLQQLWNWRLWRRRLQQRRLRSVLPGRTRN
jgi:hypothetical protein